MKLSLTKAIFAQFNKIENWVAILIGAAVTFMAWGIPSKIIFPATIVLPGFILFLFIIFILISALREEMGTPRKTLTKVLRVLGEDYKSKKKIIFLLEPSIFLPFESLVSIYYLTDDDFEQFIAFGYVFNIQGDGKIQVLIISQIDENNLLDRILSNDINVIKKILIKSDIPKSRFQEVMQ